VLSESISSASAQAGSPLTFSGTLAPAHEGERVFLERADASGLSFHVVDSAPVGADSTYSLSHTFLDPGAVRVRLAVRRDARLAGAVGDSRLIQVNAASAPLVPAAR
jgi:hypothetical protein